MITSRAAALTASVAVATALLAGPGSASAAGTSCPARSATIVKDVRGFGRVWHRGTSLYACTTVYGHAPQTRRVGPYAPATKVAFDGVNLAWTVRMTKQGRRTDRVWAANVDSGRRWMLARHAALAIGAAGPSRPDRQLPRWPGERPGGVAEDHRGRRRGR